METTDQYDNTQQPMTRGYRFLEGCSTKTIKGKSIHENFLRVYINRNEALTFAMNILRQLEHRRPDAAPEIEIPLFGRLERAPEDDL